MFGEGDNAESKIKAWLPNDTFIDGVWINAVPCEATPILIGLDMLRYYGLVLDYHNDTVYSHRLKRMVPTVRLKGGHLAVSLLPPSLARAATEGAESASTVAAARRH